MTSGPWCGTCCRFRNGWPAGADGRRATATDRCPTRFATSSTTASSGGRCPRTSRPGHGCTPSSPAGGMRDSWPSCTTGCARFVRDAEGRDPEPTAAIIDSQSVKADATVTHGSRGFDAGKKINRRKRHLLTDTLGLLLDVLVTPASTTDRDAARILLPAAQGRFGRLGTGLGRRRIHRPPRRLECHATRRRPGHRSPQRRHPRPRGAAPPLGRGKIFRLVPAQPASGPGLRTPHRYQRSRHFVVDDRAHEPPPGRPAPAASCPGSDRGSVNLPGFASTSQPRSTSRFSRALAPSTREADALSQPSTTAARRGDNAATSLACRR